MTMKKVLGCIRKADNDFDMIQDGDRICVGVSGGKDSILLLYALSIYQKFADVKFEVVGVHIEMGFGGMDFSEVDEFFASKGIILHHEHSDIYEILKLNPNKEGKIQCSLCSKFKKAAVIEASKKYECTKVAFAHHSDDAVETLFLNMLYGGKINTFQPKMYMDRTDTRFIRPLIYAYESDVTKACKEANLPIVISTCPVDKKTERETIKNMLHDIYREYPQAKNNFQLMLSNQDQLALWTKTPRKKEK